MIGKNSRSISLDGRYALLVREDNVGGKEASGIDELGLKMLKHINSGNIFFESAGSKAELVGFAGTFFRDHYPFIQFLSFG